MRRLSDKHREYLITAIFVLVMMLVTMILCYYAMKLVWDTQIRQ